jgi:uncharacterized protein involved in response to NO
MQSLLSEGLRLFFPVAAAYAVLWPLLWVGVFALDLPFARSVPPAQWHAYEMIFGIYGAALAGFLTSAVAEWTDTPPRRGRDLLLLLVFWLPGRLVGIVGADNGIWLAAMTDLIFLGLLVWFTAQPMIERRSTRHASFIAWLVLLAASGVAIRVAWLVGAFDLSERLLQTALMIFIVLFASALSRINIVVLNLALDPTGETTPYTPHPGRQNLPSALVALYAFAALLFPNSQAPAYLAIAAGCAFMDRLAEWFIGRSVCKAQVFALGFANLLAGIGFIAIGAAGLGAPLSARAGLHILGIGTLGLAVISVFIIAGLRHTGRPLILPWQAKMAIALMILACTVRVLPELGILTELLGLHYMLAALCWAGAFAVWLVKFLPFFLAPSVSCDVTGR